MTPNLFFNTYHQADNIVDAPLTTVYYFDVVFFVVVNLIVVVFAGVATTGL